MESVKTRRIVSEDRRRAVAVMNVRIHGHGRANLPCRLQRPDGDANVMDHAEALAVPGIGVVEAAAQIRGKSVLQRLAPGQRRSSRRQPKRLSGRLRKRNFQLHPFAQRQGIGLQFVHVGRRVHAQNVFVRRGLRLQEIARLRDSLGEQRVVDQSEFLRGENVRAEVQIVLRVINDLERQHREIRRARALVNCRGRE